MHELFDTLSYIRIMDNISISLFLHYLSSVSRFTETDRNGPKRTFVDTETDSLSTETDSLGTETDSLGTETDRNGPKRAFVDTETDSLSTETDSLGTETDRNGLF